MPTVLIAPDKFKGSLSAAQVADAIAAGLRRDRPDLDIASVPVADGGEGTLAAAVASGFDLVHVEAHGPAGQRVSTGYARRGKLAVVELADVSGLVRLPQGRLAARTASSRGTGEVIAAVVDAGCRHVVLGLGGSACTDGGTGMLRALGARVLDRNGDELPEGGRALADAAVLETEGLQARMRGVKVTVACDVDNPLTGPRGAAAVYGPQKGAGPAQVRELDDALTRWADLVAAETGTDLRRTPGAGAAGGVGFAALAMLGADLRSGIDLVLELTGFHRHLATADLVVTGEGALDEQTLHGKAPAGVAAAGRSLGKPVVAICGRTTLASDQLREMGISSTYALTDFEPDLERCIQQAAPLLEQVGRRIAAEHLRVPADRGG